VRTFDQIEADPTVYATLNRPSEFTVVGTIRDFDTGHRLGEIAVPVLLVSGEHDEVRPHVVEAMHARLPTSEWALFEDSIHTPHLEDHERFLETVGAFLRRVEGG
jgi:L-proline amide hydrolase